MVPSIMSGIRLLGPLRLWFTMPSRRLEDRIREICARLLVEDEPKWSSTAHELQSALQEYILRMNNLATAVFLAGAHTSERRKK